MTSRHPLSPQEAKEKFATLPPPWKMAGGKLTGEWQTADFAEVQKIVRAAMRIAEKENHHPEVAFGWNNVRVVFRTHHPPGISGLDFVCAAKLSRAAAKSR